MVESSAQLRKVAEIRYTPGESLHGGTERPFNEAGKIKSELNRRPQDVGDPRVMGYPPRRTT